MDPLGLEYPDLLARMPAVIYVADTGDQGRWHYVSSSIQAILGYSPEQWLADPTLWEQRLHPDDRDRVLAAEAVNSGGGPDTGPIEYRLLHRDGHVVWIRDDAVLVRDATGEPRWHGVLSDVTASKSAETELEHRAAQQAAVARLGEHALEGARPTELMQEAVTGAAAILRVDAAGVLELLPEERSLVLRAAVGWPDELVGNSRIPAGTASHAGYTIERREPVLVGDWSREIRFGMSPLLRRMRARSGVTVPIEGPRGPFGVLSVQSTEVRDYGSADVDFLQALANVLADAIERQNTEDRIRHQALHDPLTGLPNRALFLDRLEHALSLLPRRQSQAAVLFLDLDRFKLVNDSLGHHVGDELLAAAAPRLKQAVRASDTVARFGGDEFGILLEDIADEHAAIEMAERIAAVFTRPFILAGSEVFVTTSIGIAIARGGELAPELIRDADAAMYRAKERGSARYELFDEALRDRAMIRLRIENDLRRALERDELELVYQPLVALGTGEIVAAEALLRWNHPQRGLIGPSEFIPVAEEDGLIGPIGRWVLERACRQAASWHRMRPDSAPVGISVNLSAVQVTKRGLPEAVSEVLDLSGLDPASLNLEITESVILKDAEATNQAMRELKAVGAQIVLDDFGTGYSSLNYLTRLPIDALKIDRSFVDGLGSRPRDTAVTEAIVAMSRALSLQVVGEGVETAVQAEELAKLGCHLAQGFYFSHPVPARELSAMLLAGAKIKPAAPT